MRPIRLLVVDDSADTADVLAAVYEPRGVEVLRVRSSATCGAGGRTAVFLLDASRRLTGGGPGSGAVAGRIVPEPARNLGVDGAIRRVSVPPLFRWADLIAAIDQTLAETA